MIPTTLICFPFAAGGAAFFQGWHDALNEHFQVYPVLLPGRERRLLEPPCQTVDAAIDDAFEQLAAKLSPERPIWVFGHSLGAVLAHAFVVRLQGELGLYAQRLVASGSPGPHRPRKQTASGLADDAFLARVKEFAGFDDVAMRDPEWRELILPTLRADVEMHEQHRCNMTKIDTAVTVIRGDDDHLVSADDIEAWQELTTSPIDIVTLPGGHMYLAEDTHPLFNILRTHVSR